MRLILIYSKELSVEADVLYVGKTHHRASGGCIVEIFSNRTQTLNTVKTDAWDWVLSIEVG